ncbi:hypothetical protein NECAME_04371 [Necator americanus]|uniref:Uncharacterized protein n=1 Tax=Necator americanus TaxID=51031 RepID=W2SU68_NECAM|nr:hypothetical protein NECAME_04371 [Necator americanus]ETN73063.1 hypothetical protein NECAME_04371 [Necator americanus]
MLMMAAVLLLCALNPSRGTISKGVGLSLGVSAIRLFDLNANQLYQQIDRIGTEQICHPCPDDRKYEQNHCADDSQLWGRAARARGRGACDLQQGAGCRRSAYVVVVVGGE